MSSFNRTFNLNLFALSALFSISVSAPAPASAQTTVYKCESGGRTVTYSEKNCGGRVVSTNDAPVPVQPNTKEADVRRSERNKALVRTMHARARESPEQFETRRRRATLMRTDREECERLDKRMPVEEGMLTNPDPDEVAKAQAALGQSRTRFTQLGC